MTTNSLGSTCTPLSSLSIGVFTRLTRKVMTSKTSYIFFSRTLSDGRVQMYPWQPSDISLWLILCGQECLSFHVQSLLYSLQSYQPWQLCKRCLSLQNTLVLQTPPATAGRENGHQQQQQQRQRHIYTVCVCSSVSWFMSATVATAPFGRATFLYQHQQCMCEHRSFMCSVCSVQNCLSLSCKRGI